MTDPIAVLRRVEREHRGYEPDGKWAIAHVEALVEAAARVEAAFTADPHDVNELWNASGELRRVLAPFQKEDE